uniref:WSC domain-containing protein n=1 Tax=Macrostomum lignano TaxID=282301 RepID=A0A1I8H787_9PLAT
MLVNQRLLTALFFILSLVCLEIQACPPILPVIAGAFTGIFAAGRAVGSKRSQERPATKFKGCYADSVNARDMGKASFHSESLTHVLCRDACKKANMKHMGLQNGTECYCANKYGKYGQISTLKCDKNCPGNEKETCGGYMANTVYDVATLA